MPSLIFYNDAYIADTDAANGINTEIKYDRIADNNAQITTSQIYDNGNKTLRELINETDLSTAFPTDEELEKAEAVVGIEELFSNMYYAIKLAQTLNVNLKKYDESDTTPETLNTQT